MAVLQKLIRHFLPRSRSKGVFLFVMLCYSVILSEVGAKLIRLAGFWAVALDPVDNIQRYVRPGVDDGKLLELLVLAPILESFTMIGAIELLRRFRLGAGVQVIVSASVIFLMHATEYVFWAIFLIPAFLINAGTYLYWRSRSFWTGAEMVVALHFLFNCFPAMTLLAERLGR